LEGRIPTDRYLDAVNLYASAVAQEAQFKTTYNISIVALEEAKGTLLEYDQITLVEGPKSATSTVARRDNAAKTASHEPSAPALQPKVRLDASIPGAKDDEAKDAGPTKAVFTGKTFSFHLTVGIGPKPVEIRGSLSIAPAGSGEASRAR
jgi:hypothetical protein